jgi:hypothetical protein
MLRGGIPGAVHARVQEPVLFLQSWLEAGIAAQAHMVPQDLLASARSSCGGGVGLGRDRLRADPMANSEGSLAGQVVPDSEATIEEARVVSDVLTAVA